MTEKVSQLDYFQAFYATDGGRRVLVDIEAWIEGKPVLCSDTAMGICMLNDLMRYIKLRAGLTNPVELVALEAQAAANYEESEPETSDILGV